MQSEASAGPPARERHAARAEILAFAELIGLSTLSVSQPVLSVFGSAANQFVQDRVDAGGIVLFALAVTLFPALAAYGFERFAGLFGSPARRVAHRLSICAFAGAFASGLAKEWFGPGALRVGLPAIATVAAMAFALAKVPSIHAWLRYLAFTPALFFVVFLFMSPVTDVAFSGSATEIGVVKIDNPKPVVFLVLDEFPTVSLLDGEGNIDEGLFPNFARLASRSTWYRNNTTVSPFTETAVPAILSGQFPDDENVPPISQKYPQNLFTLLADSHHVDGSEVVTSLCPTSVCETDEHPRRGALGGALHELDRAIGVWVSGVHPTRQKDELSFSLDYYAFATKGETKPLEAFVTRATTTEPATDGRPYLHQLHVMLPHQPFHNTKGGVVYEAAAPRGLQFFLWTSGYAANAARQRHLLQLQRVDEIIGDLIDGLEANGTFDDTIIVVTADHGISFQFNEPIRGASNQNMDEIVWTPLLIKGPGQQRGAIDDRAARTIDIMPTIAEMMGMTLPRGVDGTSLLGPPPEPTAKDVRNLVDWHLNEVKPKKGDEVVRIDGALWFKRLFEERPMGSARDPAWRLFSWGSPYGDLIGRRLNNLPTGPPVEGLTASLAPPGINRPVPQGTKRLPLDFAGTFSTPQTMHLAVVVNGTIAATIGTDGTEIDGAHFFTILPPRLFLPGEHRIELYQIERGGKRTSILDPGVVLHKIPIVGEDAAP